MAKATWHKSLTKVTLLSRLLAFMLFITFPIAGFYLGIKYQRVIDLYSFFYAPTPQVSQSTKMIDISLLDMGLTKYVHVGDEITVDLGNKFSWGVSVDNPSVLQQISNNPVVYKATSPGTVTLSAAGRPACARGQLCSMLAVSFRTVIVVK